MYWLLHTWLGYWALLHGDALTIVQYWHITGALATLNALTRTAQRARCLTGACTGATTLDKHLVGGALCQRK